ncbi:MAG: phosphoadenosine phosphosulfate reductase [Pseudomonadota bacterium]
MQDDSNVFHPQLADLSTGKWLAKLAALSSEHGDFTPLGRRHFASLIDGNETLLVSFETIQGIRALSDDATPLGWELHRALGWSSMCIASDGDTWFRDDAIYAFFDSLIDDGAFDAYETVIFYGAGPCAYAAAAYSVASPGARVVAIQPQATLDPRVTEWDDRFTDMRRTDFTSRYGYAPDMLDAAEHAFVLYDPEETLDAMHAALFTRDNATKFRLRYLGDAIQTHLIEMGMLYRILAKVAAGKLDAQSFAKLWRLRRDYPPYLRGLMSATDADQRDVLTMALCENVTGRMNAPRFARRLKELQTPAGAQPAADEQTASG